MSTTVAANVVAVNADGSLEEREQRRIREQDTSWSVVEAEVVGTSVGNGNMPTMTPVAANATESRRVVAPTGVNAIAVAPIGSQSTHHDHSSSDRVMNQHTAFYRSIISTAFYKIGHAENVSDVLLAMTEHPTSARVQTAALKKLGDLTHDKKKTNTRQHNAVICSDNKFQVDKHRQMIGMTNGVSLILNALRTFPLDVNLQTSGLLAIGNACRHNKENTCVFGDAGAIDLILKAMCQFVEDIQLQRNGLFSIYTLSLNNSKNKAAVRDLGGIPMLLGSMQQYQYDFEVQRNGLTCLGNLAAKDAKNCLQIGENGGIDVVFSAMSKFHQDDSIQDRACLTIAFLAKLPEMRIMLKHKGAITFVTKAATVIGDTKSSVVNALHALKTNKQEFAI
jgi:hypothetical protein